MDALRQYGWFVGGALVALAGFAAPQGYDLLFWLGGAVLACGGVIDRDTRKGVLASALLAAGANAYLFSRKLDSATGSSVCNVNDVINCDVVNTSAASELFGLPITLFGLAFYLGLAIAASLAEKTTPRFHQVNGLFALFNLGVSAWLAWESKKIGAVCAMCITIYACNGLLMWAALKGLAETKATLFDGIGKAPTSWTSLILASVFGLVVLVGAGQWRSQGTRELVTSHGQDHDGGGPKKVDTSNPEHLATLYGLPRGPLTVDGTEPLLGSPDARYKLVEFADFGCPHCARAFEEVHQLVKESPDFNVRFKVFPLTAACNPGLQNDTGPERCRAAQAAECAGRQERFWDMANLIFANQAYMTDPDLTFMAEQIKLDMDAWRSCMNDPTVLEGIVEDAKAGLQVGVMGTPAFFMQGTHGESWVEVPQGVPAAYALAEAQKNGISLPEPTAQPAMQP